MRDHETKGCLCRTLELSPEEIRENPVPSCLAIHIMMEFFFCSLTSKSNNVFHRHFPAHYEVAVSLLTKPLLTFSNYQHHLFVPD